MYSAGFQSSSVSCAAVPRFGKHSSCLLQGEFSKGKGSHFIGLIGRVDKGKKVKLSLYTMQVPRVRGV
jgi:hypothetical protein